MWARLAHRPCRGNGVPPGRDLLGLTPPAIATDPQKRVRTARTMVSQPNFAVYALAIPSRLSLPVQAWVPFHQDHFRGCDTSQQQWQSHLLCASGGDDRTHVLQEDRV